MSVVDKCIWAELLVKVLTTLINLNDDPNYTKDDATSDLLKIVKFLEQIEPNI